MDREDSYPDQNHHHGKVAGSHWEDLCGSVSISSHSSDEDIKPMQHRKGELFPDGANNRDYPPAVVSLLPHSGPSTGMGQSLDIGGPPYSGKDYLQSLHRVSLVAIFAKRVLKLLRGTEFSFISLFHLFLSRLEIC